MYIGAVFKPVTSMSGHNKGGYQHPNISMVFRTTSSVAPYKCLFCNLQEFSTRFLDL